MVAGPWMCRRGQDPKWTAQGKDEDADVIRALGPQHLHGEPVVLMLVLQNPQEGLPKPRWLGLSPGVSVSGGLGWAQESAFLTSPR